MKKLVVVVAAVAFAILFAGTFVFLWAKSSAPKVTYETETPFVTDILKKSVATGSVLPRQEVAIKPQVSGIIAEMLVEPGDVVKEGDLIARIRVVPNTASLASAENRVNRSRISLQDAERDLARQRRLKEEGTVSVSALEKAEVARAQAQEELDAARDALEIVRRGSTAKSSASANTLVRSTLAGTVLDVPVEQGSSVIEANTFNDGTTLATVADMSSLVFKGKVDESEVGKLAPGMPLVLVIGALQDERFDATLEHVAPKGKEEGGAVKFEIRAAVMPKDGVFVRANYSASADIVLDRRDQVLAIHENVLQWAGDKPQVEVEIAPQVFERRDVELGLSDGIAAELLSGVAAGDRLKKPALFKPAS